MVEGILDGLRWLGLDWDEGPKVGGPHGPYLQSERLDRYRGMADDARRAAAHAYYCYCTPDELKAKRETAERRGGAWRYDRTCCRLTPPEIEARERDKLPRAIRFKVPGRTTRFDDLVHGPIEFDGANIEDFVILRSDGHPTYHLSVVSDDVEMGITHVVRGDDHISNTPKQILLYRSGRRAGARVRSRAADSRSRQEAVEQAPRRDLGDGVRAAGVPARGDGELPRAARLGAGRPIRSSSRATSWWRRSRSRGSAAAMRSSIPRSSTGSTRSISRGSRPTSWRRA